MINYNLKYTQSSDNITITLPLSKSESNRLLLIAALAGVAPSTLDVSKCDDTDAMIYGLTTSDHYINIGAAGTAMRFLTAYFSNNYSNKSEVILDGSERMRQRPIKPLVDALQQLGGTISYKADEGFPPLIIKGEKLHGGEIWMDASVSSQYISALMMIAPTFMSPLQIRFKEPPVSLPYIQMTAAMMRQCNARVEVQENGVKVFPGEYKLNDMAVEPDWSAASYWFEIVALSGRTVHLPGLKRDSLQGDSGIIEIFRQMGANACFANNGLTLSPCPIDDSPLNVDLENMPDVAQTVAVTAAMLGKPFEIKGLSTLPSKETDRLMALKRELEKLGVSTEITSDSIRWDSKVSHIDRKVVIDTYKDHRMAMAFAPAAIKHDNITINDIEVVSKSYPDYWKDLSKFGFSYNL